MRIADRTPHPATRSSSGRPTTCSSSERWIYRRSTSSSRPTMCPPAPPQHASPVWCSEVERRPSDGVDEEQLAGGIANAGQVVRVGPHVLRPSSPHARSIHVLLRAVRDAGFDGAPSPVGIDEDGRERLVYIDGDVPVPPYPAWSQS